MNELRKKRVGLIGSRPVGRSYMRAVDRRVKLMKAAEKEKDFRKRQMRLPGF